MSHMPYDRLAQAVPPDYSQWIFSQMCMRIVEKEFGCPAITFDMMKARPSEARLVLSHWLRGAGADRPAAGMSWKVRREDQEAYRQCGAGFNRRVAGPLSLYRQGSREETGHHSGDEAELPGVPVRFSKVEYSPATPACLLPECSVGELDAPVCNDAIGPRIDESTFRELFYAHVGDFDTQWSNLGPLPWLKTLRECTTLAPWEIPSVHELVGRSTYLEVSAESRPILMERVRKAIQLGGRGGLTLSPH